MPRSAIFSKPNKYTPTIFTVRSYGKESRALWAEPSISPETIRKAKDRG